MKKFDRLEEMQPYQNKKTGSYEFKEDGELLDIQITFDLTIEGDIKARKIDAFNIKAGNIEAGNINAGNINALDIEALDITALNINACNIDAVDITAWNIDACNIDAGDMKAWNINALDIIDAGDIKALSIKAEAIRFHAVCYADNNIICKLIKGIHENARYFTLDGEVIIEEN